MDVSFLLLDLLAAESPGYYESIVVIQRHNISEKREIRARPIEAFIRVFPAIDSGNTPGNPKKPRLLRREREAAAAARAALWEKVAAYRGKIRYRLSGAALQASPAEPPATSFSNYRPAALRSSEAH